MKFTLVWSPRALEQLTEIWLDASDRSDVTSSTNEIDRRLRRNPTTQGEPWHEGYWELSVPPLTVIFEVREADCIVEIAGIRRIAVE